MHLARTVTHSTVAECKERMSRAEFRHWWALFLIQPWGDEWNQVNAMAAASLAPWQDKTARNIQKFFPSPPEKTAEETEQMMNSFAKRHNARVARNQRQRRKGAQP